MKRVKIIVLFFVLFLASSCEKMSDNGKLDGMWQLMSIEHNGTTEHLKDRTQNSHLYYCLQMNLICLQYYGGGGEQGIIKFTGDSLHIEIGVIKKENIIPFGMKNVKESFAVEVLNENNLILKSVESRLTLRRF